MNETKQNNMIETFFILFDRWNPIQFHIYLYASTICSSLAPCAPTRLLNANGLFLSNFVCVCVLNNNTILEHDATHFYGGKKQIVSKSCEFSISHFYSFFALLSHLPIHSLALIYSISFTTVAFFSSPATHVCMCVCVCPFRFNCLNIKNVFHFVPFRIINTLERLLHQQHTNKNVLGYANEWQTKDRITKELRAEIQWNGAWVVGGRGKKESKEIKIREEISNSSNSRSSNSNKSDICMLRPFGMRSFHIIYMYCVYIYYMHPFDPYVPLLLDKMTEQRPSNKSMIW